MASTQILQKLRLPFCAFASPHDVLDMAKRARPAVPAVHRLQPGSCRAQAVQRSLVPTTLPASAPGSTGCSPPSLVRSVLASPIVREKTLQKRRYRKPPAPTVRARRPGLTSGQLFTWRRLAPKGMECAGEITPFVPAIVDCGDSLVTGGRIEIFVSCVRRVVDEVIRSAKVALYDAHKNIHS